MPGHQRILVVSDGAGDADLTRIRRDLGRDLVVLTAPTADARRVVQELAPTAEPQVEVLLAPTTFPPADRGHRLDALVRSHALDDRFREVVVVTDPATSTLLLRVLAPDQLATGGAVTIVGLPRADPPTPVRRAVASGAVLGAVGGWGLPQAVFLVPIVLAALVGLVLLTLERRRPLGRELLVVSGVAVVVLLVVVAGSTRFPAAF